MTESSHGVRLTRRILQEHKRAVIVLVGALLVNIAAYVLLVRPLVRSVANVEQSTVAAEKALEAARAEHARASGTLTGKDRATKELATFYSSVLPQNLSGARRLTHGRLARLAAESKLTYRSGRYEPIEERSSTLVKLKTNVELAGSYRDMRTFIHAIETAPEFVVVENVSLAEDTEGSGTLKVLLDLATYFRTSAP